MTLLPDAEAEAEGCRCDGCGDSASRPYCCWSSDMVRFGRYWLCRWCADELGRGE